MSLRHVSPLVWCCRWVIAANNARSLHCFVGNAVNRRVSVRYALGIGWRSARVRACTVMALKNGGFLQRESEGGGEESAGMEFEVGMIMFARLRQRTGAVNKSHGQWLALAYFGWRLWR